MVKTFRFVGTMALGPSFQQRGVPIREIFLGCALLFGPHLIFLLSTLGPSEGPGGHIGGLDHDYSERKPEGPDFRGSLVREMHYYTFSGDPRPPECEAARWLPPHRTCHQRARAQHPAGSASDVNSSCSQSFQYKLWIPEEDYVYNRTADSECSFMDMDGMANIPPLPLTSAASATPWSHSLFSLIPSWTKKIVIKRESFASNQPIEATARSGLSDYGLTFEKCAVVNTGSEPQTASVNLKAMNNQSAAASDMSDLVILDGVTGLTINENGGSSTGNGYQTYSRAFLPAGDYFEINYVAVLNTTVSQTGKTLSLPAELSFNRSSPSPQRVSLVAQFNITVQEKPMITPDHGMHAVGFAVAFVVSLLLTFLICILIHQIRKRKCCFSSNNLGNRNTTHEQKLESSQLDFADSKIEDLITNDRLLDILAFEETENMLQALEDNETTLMTQADAHLESCRQRICKDGIFILLRNMAFNNNISLQEEKILQDSIKENCLTMEKSLHEEYERKMVALTAECNLETRKEMDLQHQKQMVSNEEVGEIVKQFGPQYVTEYRSLVDELWDKEQYQMKRLLLLKQEEEFVKVHRQQAFSQRTALHEIFFQQLQDAAVKKHLKKDGVISLANDYSAFQEETEDLVDFFEANKKYHLAKRYACRKYLIYNLQLSENRTRCHLNTAATQIASLINKMQSSGHLNEHHSTALLNQAQAEVLSVKQKLDNALKHETRKLHQKLVTKRRRLILQKLKEQRKGLISVEGTCKSTRDVGHCLSAWRKLLSDQSLEFEELVEKLDYEASEELKVLKCNLTDKATEDLRNIQNVVIMQALLKVPVPRLPLQQALEDHRKDLALRTRQLEDEENDKDAEAKVFLENTRRKLSDDLKLNLKEQKSLRNWEQLVFQKIIGLPLVLSEEEFIRLRHEFSCSFSQMDSSLALPMAHTRLMLERRQSEWRKCELLKVDQHLASHDRQENFNMKKQYTQDKRLDALKKSVQDKLHIYEESVTEETRKQVHRELLLERVQQLKAQEARLGEYIASLQFQRSVESSKAQGMHIAVINLQSLLFEELCSSQTLTVSECTQLLERQSHENGELYRKLQSESLQNELTEQDLMKKNQRSLADCLEVHNEVEENVDRRTTAVLKQAMDKCKHIIDQHRESLKEEELYNVLIEGKRETMEMDCRSALHSQELRLASHLTKLAIVPVGMMHRVLHLLLPSASEHEMLSLLNPIFHKYSDANTESDDNAVESDGGRKGKPQEAWKALETRLRQSLISQGLEKTQSSIKKKGSILKKKRLRPVKRVSFSQIESLSKLPPVEPYGLSKTIGESAEEDDYPDTHEKLFVFRLPKESTVASTKSSKKKKKRNFLNFKKTSIANLDD